MRSGATGVEYEGVATGVPFCDARRSFGCCLVVELLAQGAMRECRGDC